MPRRKRKSLKREIAPDYKYGSVVAGKFINCMMWDGKKTLSQKIFYRALEKIKEKISDKEPIEVFHQAVENVKPVLEIRSRRVGGANYQIPIEVRPERRLSLAIRWLVQAARSRPERTMVERLANEIVDAYNKTGLAIKKREDTHRMAEANRAFAHYRW
ncbi:30S ribosomal protein S7 [Candidatus Sumerlaeota bacterium]|nr:30S ribosomal protein S7 [Candidatus Sumerlaeota bacterium]